jgi:hypothetical protein
MLFQHYFAEVLPLVYNALESEHATVGLVLHVHINLRTNSNKVQERALNAVPNLCETVDYAEVSNVLFPRVAVRTFTVFSSTTFEFYRSLSSWFSPKLGYFPSKSPHLQLS